MKWHGYPVSANVSLLFTELPYLRRFAAAKAAGFTHVESWWPFPDAYPEQSQLDAVAAAISTAGVSLTGLNVFAGDMTAGERGIASNPDRTHELERGLEALSYLARATGCRSYNLLYGTVAPERTPGEQREHAIRAYRLASDVASSMGGTILVEPLARGLNGAYPLETAEDALALIAEVDTPAVKLLVDSFHLGTNGEDLVRLVEQHSRRIGHVQLADTPGRGEPGSGTLDFAALGQALRENGYSGTVAAEYRPTRETSLTLDWLEAPNEHPLA